MPLTTPMKTATFLIRITPEERERLNELAREQRISLAHAMREGAKLYLEDMRRERRENDQVGDGVRLAT